MAPPACEQPSEVTPTKCLREGVASGFVGSLFGSSGKNGKKSAFGELKRGSSKKSAFGELKRGSSKKSAFGELKRGTSTQRRSRFDK